MNLTKAFCVLVLSLLTTIAFSQSSANIDKLLQVNKTKETTQARVKEVLAFYQKKYPNVSFMTWSGIEANINYQTYFAKVREAYRSSYSEAEIKELIKLYNPKTMDQYEAKSKRIEQKLYDIGKEFGKELSAQIQAKVK